MPEWNPLMGVGVEEIDRGHRELMEEINALGRAMKKGRGSEVMSDLLAFLRAHAEAHFAVEEELMVRSGYPDYRAHRAMHEAFREQLAARTDAFLRDPGTPGHVVETHGWIMQWLSHHEIAADAPFGEYLQEKGSGD